MYRKCWLHDEEGTGRRDSKCWLCVEELTGSVGHVMQCMGEMAGSKKGQAVLVM